MVQINFALKEVNCKVVYYGPGLSGKTTNLEVVHAKAPTSHVGELTSIATEGDRTLFFDFLPLSLGTVAGMNTKFQIYTVPGQVYYNSTRKLVLQGADGIVFVADSRASKMDECLESLANLEENLREYGMDIKTMPFVLQYNKRDLPDVLSLDELNAKINPHNVPFFEAVAVKGEGVFPTLKKLSSMVLENLNRQHSSTAIRKTSKHSTTTGVREPVGVGVAASGAAAAARSGSSPAAQTASPAASVKASPRKQGAQSVEERVTELPGVKSIQRRAPAAGPAASQAPAAPAIVKKRAPAPFPSEEAEAPDPKKRGQAGVVAAVVVVLLLAGAAAAYFGGLFEVKTARLGSELKVVDTR